MDETGYFWEKELGKVVANFYTNIPDNSEGFYAFLEKTICECARLFQKSIGNQFDESCVPEVMDFLKKSVVTINLATPKKELFRVAVKIPTDPLRIEFRLINSSFTKSGHLPYIDEICPEPESGKCIAVAYLTPPPPFGYIQ